MPPNRLLRCGRVVFFCALVMACQRAASVDVESGQSSTTASLVAARLVPVSAAATSSAPPAPVVNLTTTAGLTETAAGSGDYALTNNIDAPLGSMWFSWYLGFGADEGAIVDFDLGSARPLTGFHVWNFNNEGETHRGMRDVEITVSDDGQRWRHIDQRFRFARASGLASYLGEDQTFDTCFTSRFVRFRGLSTYRAGGQADLAGLGKVQFVESADANVACPPVTEQSERFPVGVGAINVRKAPYNAVGDGVSDDTAAIARAIADYAYSGRLIYFPEGNSLVSSTLDVPADLSQFGRTNFVGDGPSRSQLILRDGTFLDAANSQAVLSLGSHSGKGITTADWFDNNVEDLSINVGANNPGAIGLRFYSNNIGAVRNVEIRAGEGSGTVGIDLGYADQNGPLLISEVSVTGFDFGVRTGATVNSQTISGQVQMVRSSLWARQLNTENDTTNVDVSGASTARVLGLKTERSRTLFNIREGSTVEVLGGLAYVQGNAAANSMFLVDESSRLSLSIEEVVYGISVPNQTPYTNLVEVTGATPLRLAREGTADATFFAPLRAGFIGGSIIPLFVR